VTVSPRPELGLNGLNAFGFFRLFSIALERVLKRPKALPDILIALRGQKEDSGRMVFVVAGPNRDVTVQSDQIAFSIVECNITGYETCQLVRL